MTPARYERVRELFLAARVLPREQRDTFLQQASGGDDALQAEVASLLANDTLADTFLQTPALGSAFAARGPESLVATGADGTTAARATGAPPAQHPAQLGQYRVLDVIGQGGMGVVYRAEQMNPRRTVALKVIRPGLQSRDLLKRFAHEGQVLGLLQHPGIAQVFEAGMADAGCGPQPFFAMELIFGAPLKEFAETHRLDVRARLELLAKICDAVQHAHQKGVIHRDLKPANILVDQSGQPKILDFGVARATDADLRATTPETLPGQLIGTLAYMSPEQISGDPRELDTRSDVYALGIIGYELLTGHVPFDVSTKTIPQVARAIVEEEPPALGTINRAFRGDLATIIAKALEKDKNRRYQSASEFAEDLRRYLANQPILARPATTFYQLRKFAARNKPVVAGVCVALAALVIGIAGTTAQAVRATRARDRARAAELLAEQRLAEAEMQRAEAQRQAAIAQAVNEFLNDDLLAAADPEQQGRDVTVRAVLDRAAQAIEGRFGDEPLVEAAVRATLGETYHRLGADAAGVELLERAVALYRAQLGEDHLRTLHAMNWLGLTYAVLGRYVEAEDLLLRGVEGRRRLYGESDGATLAAMNHLALLYERQGRPADEEALLQKTLSLAEAHLKPEDETLQTALVNLGDLYRRQRRYAEAEPLLVRALEVARRVRGDAHPATLNCMGSLSTLYSDQGRLAEAEPLCLATLEGRRRALGDEHPKTLASMNALAVVYKRQGRFDAAEALYLETLEIKRRVLGPDNPATLVSLNNLGALYATAGRHAEAEPYFVQTLAARRRVLGDDHPLTVSSLRNLAELYVLMRRYDEAVPLAVEHYERVTTARGPEHDDTRKALELLIGVHEAAGRADLADQWRAKLPTSQPTE